MQESQIADEDARGKRGRVFRLDPLFIVFLVISWSLIFASASLALQRAPQEWLPVNLAPQVVADYRVSNTQVPKLAPVRPQIIEAVKRDAQVNRIPEAPTALAEHTSVVEPGLLVGPTRRITPSPTPTRTPTLALAMAGLLSAGGPYAGEEGQEIPLQARVASSVPGPVRYQWDLDGDGAYDDAQGMSTSVKFDREGDYLVGVQVIDSTGAKISAMASVHVTNVGPRIYMEDDKYIDEGGRVSFSAAVSDPGNDPVSASWDFGDGATESDTLHPKHTYVDDGDYEVRLYAKDDAGAVSQATLVVHVRNVAPQAEAGPDQVVDEGGTLDFTGQASDPGVLDTLTYTWDFDYDGAEFNADATGPRVSGTFPDGPAEVVVALLVEDKDSAQRIDTLKVTVNNVAPTITGVSTNSPVGEGSPMTLSVQATDPGKDPLYYDFDWNGDGNFDEQDQAGSVSHIWPNQGEFEVGIRVRDKDGGQALAMADASIYNVAPSARISPPSATLEGAAVTWDGSGSSDPGAQDQLSYVWNFGDGSPPATEAVASHTYVDNGVYTATLSVTDDSAETGRTSAVITILNANPVVDAGPDRTINEGDSIEFAGNVSDPGSADELSYAWDFDLREDGFHSDSRTATPDKEFPDGPANYVVALRVRDDDYPYPMDGGGEIGEAMDTLNVRVENVPPRADAGGPYEGVKGRPVTLTGSGEDVAADQPTLMYAWDVDGSGRYSLEGQEVITTWNQIGVYTVTLRVADKDGGENSSTARVTIVSGLPTADAGGPYEGNEGSPIDLHGQGTDPSGDQLYYAWNLDGRPGFETRGQDVTHVWDDNGTYTVTLRVDDRREGPVTDVTTVTVHNVAPTARAGPDQVVSIGEPVSFSGTASDPGADTLTYEWDFDYDGTNFTVDADGPDVSYTYPSTPGTYTVALRVTDDDGDWGLDTAHVSVQDVPPSADTNGPYIGNEGQTITLQGSGSDPAGGQVSYAWDLDDDGEFETVGQQASHAWPDNGKFTVALQVANERGGTATDSTTVTVSNVNPTVEAGGPYTTQVDVPVTLEATGNDVPADPLSFAWDLNGDDVFDDDTGPLVTYSWPVSQTYTVAVQVEDGDGGVASDTATVDVH
jgi:PKD repeat protein